jgi:hypothetical protein
MGVPASTEVLPKDSVVFLNVPPNKTTPGYTEPVDPIVADVVEVGAAPSDTAADAGC